MAPCDYRVAMTKTITTDALKRLRKGAEGFVLIDVLSKAQFDKDHIPGATNVPIDTKDFVAGVADKASGSKNRKVVLYCSGPECDASTKGAQLLAANGFTSVIEYEGGMSSWRESERRKPATSGARTN